MKKIWLYIVFFFLFSLNSYAFDAKISVSKDNLDLNDYTKIRIQVDHDNTKDINIKEVKWLDDFVILSKSSSSSYSSNVVIVDWKTQTESKSSDFIDLTISPKKIWNYSIWPAIIESDNETKETNIVSVNVSEIKSSKNNIQHIKKNDDNIFFLVILWIISFLILISLYLYHFKKELFLKLISKVYNKNQKIEDEVVQDNALQVNVLDYPSLTDENFVEKIHKIFITKIKTKYYIEQIEKKSNEEIYELIPSDLSDKELIWKIIFSLNKLKYSNEAIEKNELIELIKKI